MLMMSLMASAMSLIVLVIPDKKRTNEAVSSCMNQLETVWMYIIE